jgi:large subunit ribosomal protein L25
MEFVKLNAALRAAHGKGNARRVRKEGLIPAVAYGRTLKNMPISVDPAALVKNLQGPNGLNTVMHLDVDGGEKDLLVMVREFTHHPITRKFLHADFIQVKLDEEVEVEVPFVTTGKPVGITQGGVLHQIYRKLPLRCRPEAIPAQISADITALELGHALKVSGLNLPAGVSARLPAEQSIVSIVAPEKEVVEEPVPGAPGAPAAAGAAAAPAAAAAGAKAGAAAPAAKAEAKPAAKKK